MLQCLMGIVAGYAGEAGVSPAPALAVFQTVGSKADVVDSDTAETVGDHVFPGAVAGAAEVHRIYRIQAAEVRDQLLALFWQSRFHGRGVSGGRTVAGFAGNAEDGGIRVKLIPGCGSGRVAAKTAARLGWAEAAPRSVFNIRRRRERMLWSDIQSLGRGIEAELAFIEASVSLIEVCLTHMADAECPKQVRGERLRVIADGEGALVAFGDDLFAIGAKAKCQMVVLAKYLRVWGAGSGMGHGGGLLSGELGGVAFRARGGTGVHVPGRVTFGRPPAGGLEPQFGGQGDATRGRNLS